MDCSTHQVTHKAAYSMYRISEFKRDKIMLNISNGVENGLLMFAKNKPGEIAEINPINKSEEG